MFEYFHESVYKVHIHMYVSVTLEIQAGMVRKFVLWRRMHLPLKLCLLKYVRSIRV